MTDFAPVNTSHESLDPQLEYQAVEPWAIVGFLLALLSPLALINWPLWLISPLAIGANLIALRRLRLEPGRPGRAAAIAGLGLAFLFGVIPWARILSERMIFPDQAKPVAEQFFEFLREGSPEKALMMKFTPESRRPFDENFWLFFRRDADARGELLRLVEDPTVRTLLALGKRAHARYYKTSTVMTDGTQAGVVMWYTITFDDDDGKKKTFFVRLVLNRKPWERKDLNPWLIKTIQSGIDPSRDGG